MRYICEVVKSGKKVPTRYYIDASHPNEAIRKSIMAFRKEHPDERRFSVFVVNENAEVWASIVYKNTQDGKYYVKEHIKSSRRLPKDKFMIVQQGVFLADVLR